METLKIFISGTQIDLKCERDAVEKAIKESLYSDVIRAETRSASDRTPRAEVKEMVRECDIFVGVYGYRYGYIPEGDSISVTEFEFEEAKRLQKPILGYLKAETDKDKREPRQQTFISNVFDFNKGIFRRPEFTNPDELADWVAEDVWTEIVRIVRERGGFVPPFLAPRRLNVFIGRDSYIQELSSRLKRGEAALVYGFYGIGGLGKTALAVELAYRLRNHFDGGVLWADLPTTQPDQTLAAWAHEYGADKISSIKDTDARADALRSILHGKRVLAILDGAVDEADDAKIAPLLRALAECAVIVTSRITQLGSLANAHRVDLERMSVDEAVELFERIVGNALPRDKIIEIARVVDFLPLALDLIAAQWREHRKSWTADDVLAMLRDERARLDTLQWGDGRTRGIRASIQLSYNRLSEDKRRFFDALGVFAGDDFDVHAVAYVMNEDEGRTRERLERFLRLSLLQEGRRAMRYRMHPLLRDFAREKTTYRERLNRRMARYYCKVAQENGLKLQGIEVVRALEILDLEWGNIAAGQAWASGRGRDKETSRMGNKERWKLCRDYIIALAPYFVLRAMWDEWIAWSEVGIAACQRLVDVCGEGVILSSLGLVYANKGDWDKAIELYQKTLAISEQFGDLHGMASTYNNLGVVYRKKGEWDKALEFYQKSLAIKEQLGDRHGMAITYNNLGLVYQKKGEWDKAIEFYQKSLAISEQLGDRYGMAITYNNLGLVYRAKREWNKAIEFYQKSLAIKEQLGNVVGLATTWWNMALVYEKQGKINQAIELMEKAIAIEKKIGHPNAAKHAVHLARLRGG